MFFTSKKFQRKKEDFTCGQCGFFVQGSGYTNHCPKCLWSKHVDVNPGDRAAECNGLMKPIGVEVKKGEHIIIHECVKCGHIKKNKTSKDDSFDVLIKLSKKTGSSGHPPPHPSADGWRRRKFSVCHSERSEESRM